MDIASVTGKGWYSNIFMRKNKQLAKFNSREDIKAESNSLCVFFHKKEMYNEKKMYKSINYYRYARDKNGMPIDKRIKYIYCVIKGEKFVRRFSV